MAWRSARVVLAGCLALAAVLLLADLRGAAPTAALRGMTGAVVGPIERGISAVRTAVGQRVGGSAAEQQRIAELEAQLAQVRAEAAAAARGSLSKEQARELAAWLPAQGYGQVPARTVAVSGPQDQVRSVAVSAGSDGGISPGDAVAAPGGLAGLVSSVAPRVATVRLVVDADMALAVRVVSSGEVGVLRGTGQGATVALLDPLGAMAPGDLVVTLGTADGALPADLPVGRISAISGSAADLTRFARVTPAVDDSTLDRVVVLVPEATP